MSEQWLLDIKKNRYGIATIFPDYLLHMSAEPYMTSGSIVTMWQLHQASSWIRHRFNQHQWSVLITSNVKWSVTGDQLVIVIWLFLYRKTCWQQHLILSGHSEPKNRCARYQSNIRSQLIHIASINHIKCITHTCTVCFFWSSFLLSQCIWFFCFYFFFLPFLKSFNEILCTLSWWIS